MSEEAIAAIQADLAHDLYELAASHREEITRLIEEFDVIVIRIGVWDRQGVMHVVCNV